MEDTKKVPLLRFPEFSGDWEVRKLKKIASKINSKNRNCTLTNVLTNSAIQGIINQDDYFDRDIANKNNLGGYYIVDINDFVYNPRISSNALVGSLKKNNNVKGVMSPLYTVFRFKKGVLSFFEQYFETVHWHRYMKNIANTGARHDRLNITNDSFFDLPLPYPFMAEQQKIAGFLTKIDNKIEKLSKKKQLLENYKKGILQNIFSQKVRFVDNYGKNYTDWKEKEMGDFLIHRSIRNKSNEIDLVLSVSNKKGFITQNEQFNGYSVASKDTYNYKVVVKNDFAYNPSRINVGSIARLKYFEKGIVSPMYVVFKLKENLNNVFFENLYTIHNFKHLIKIGCSGSVRDSLNFNDLEKFKVKIPSIEEQEKIAKFLTEIDNKINLVEKKLTDSKQYKKSLLQKMFI